MSGGGYFVATSVAQLADAVAERLRASGVAFADRDVGRDRQIARGLEAERRLRELDDVAYAAFARDGFGPAPSLAAGEPADSAERAYRRFEAAT